MTIGSLSVRQLQRIVWLVSDRVSAVSRFIKPVIAELRGCSNVHGRQPVAAWRMKLRPAASMAGGVEHRDSLMTADAVQRINEVCANLADQLALVVAEYQGIPEHLCRLALRASSRCLYPSTWSLPSRRRHISHARIRGLQARFISC